MAVELFGDVEIFRPSMRIEEGIRDRARANLRSRFRAGEYRGASEVNEVLHHQFRIYELCFTH